MKFCTSILFSFLIVIISAVGGEQTVSVGVSGGYSVPVHFGTFNFVNPEYDSTEFGKTRYSFDTGRGFQFGVNGVFGLDKAGRFSLSASGVYSYLSSKTDQEGNSYPGRLPNGDIVRIETFYRNEYSQGSLTANLDFRFIPFDDSTLGILAGASGSYILSSFYRFTYNLTDKNDNPSADPFDPFIHKPYVKDFPLRFANDSNSSILMYEGELPDITPLQVSLRTGVFYDFSIRGIILSPSIVYQFPLTKISSSQDWKIHQLIGSIDVRYQL